MPWESRRATKGQDVERVMAVSRSSPGTYLIDCGGGWACIYRRGGSRFGWVSEPHRLDALKANDSPLDERHDWLFENFVVHDDYILQQTERAARESEPSTRRRFEELGLITSPNGAH
jgi:hypothetical protein